MLEFHQKKKKKSEPNCSSKDFSGISTLSKIVSIIYRTNKMVELN
jgi:hypothetical protein